MNGDLPSGQQAEDMWKQLQDKLWFQDRKEAQRKKDLMAANEARKASPVVIDDGKTADDGDGNRSTANNGKGKRRQNSTSPSSEENEELIVKNEANVSERGEDEDDEGDDEEKYGPRPDSWIHPASLVFSLFGRPAGKDEDVDLQMTMTSGVSGGSKRQTDDSADSSSMPGDFCASDDEDSQTSDASRKGAKRLSTNSLQLMSGAGGKQSRAKLKKMKQVEREAKKSDEEARGDAELKRKVLERLAAPPQETPTIKKLANSVETLSESIALATARAQWAQEVKARESQLLMLERRGKGTSEKALKLEEELTHLYDNPHGKPSSDGPPANSQVISLGDGGSNARSVGIDSREGGHGGGESTEGVDAEGGSVSGGVEVVEVGHFGEVPGNAPEPAGASLDVRI